MFPAPKASVPHSVGLASLFLISGATSAHGQNRPAESPRVEVALYSVAMPTGKGWKTERDSPTQTVRFELSRKWLLSKVQEVTLVVVRDSASEEHWPLTSAELADALLGSDLLELRTDAAQNRYEVRDAVTVVDTVADREVHSLRFQKVLHLPERWREDFTHLIYFPPDYVERHVWYSFFMSDLYKAPSGGQAGVKHEPELISNLVASLQIE